MTIKQNFDEIQERITRVAQRVKRNPKDVKLITVTKAQPAEVLQEAIDAGAGYLGESYPEEAVTKMKALATGPEIEWHMIGPIQSRKAKLVAEHFSFVQTLSREKVASRLNSRAQELGKQIPALVQVNVSGESSKSGLPAWDATNLSELFHFLDLLEQYPAIEVKGLMTIPPFHPDPENARPFFVQACKIRDILAQRYSSLNWDELSFGMSGDFEVAVEEGATFVRVGTAIVGARLKKTL